MSSSAPLFGVFFVGKSYPITSNHFTAVDPTHWVLDVGSSVTPEYWNLQEVAFFLTAPAVLDTAAALGLYVKAGPSEWLYRGCVHNGDPSQVMPLQWPTQNGGTMSPAQPGHVQIGISVEPVQELAAKEGSRLGDKLEWGKRVAMDLFHFLGSFSKQQVGDVILIPSNAIEFWMKRFSEKFKRDPNFLTRRSEVE